MKIYIGVDKSHSVISSSPLKWNGNWFHWLASSVDNRCVMLGSFEETIRDYILSEAGLVNAPVGSIGELEI